MKKIKEEIIITDETIITLDGKHYPVSSLSFSDIRKHYGTGRAYTISGSGKDRKMGYRSGIMTNIGDIEVAEWAAIVKYMIKRDGEQELYDNLLAWVKEDTRWFDDEEDNVQFALECHAARIFDDEAWVDFLRFNQKYRPSLLSSLPLISILINCCPGTAKVTEKMVERAKEVGGKICCPHCGVYSEFQLVTSQ